MRCRKVQKNLPAYLEHLLAPEVEDALIAHVAQCATCRQDLESYEEMWSLVQGLPIEYPSEEAWASFLPDLQARIEAERPQDLRPYARESFSPFLRIGLVAACLALIALAVWRFPLQRPREAAPREPSLVEAISTVLIDEAEAEELILLNDVPDTRDPLILVTDEMGDEEEPTPVELSVDLTALEEAFDLDENGPWQVAIYQER